MAYAADEVNMRRLLYNLVKALERAVVAICITAALAMALGTCFTTQPIGVMPVKLLPTYNLRNMT